MNFTLRQALKSRTLWLAIILGVLSVLQDFVVDLPMTPGKQALIGCVLAVVIAVLRIDTTEALGDK